MHQPTRMTGKGSRSPKSSSSSDGFLLIDTGEDDDERILVFGTAKSVENLANYKDWAIDGTFKTSAKQWYQSITIHAVLGINQSVPRICCPIKRAGLTAGSTGWSKTCNPCNPAWHHKNVSRRQHPTLPRIFTFFNGHK